MRRDDIDHTGAYRHTDFSRFADHLYLGRFADTDSDTDTDDAGASIRWYAEHHHHRWAPNRRRLAR